MAARALPVSLLERPVIPPGRRGGGPARATPAATGRGAGFRTGTGLGCGWVARHARNGRSGSWPPSAPAPVGVPSGAACTVGRRAGERGQEGVESVATIHAETGRPFRVLPSLDAGQAATLAAAAAVTWLLVRSGMPAGLRVGLGGTAALAGFGLALVRWPPGPAGERLAVWVGRAVAYAARPRRWRGAQLAARLGATALFPPRGPGDQGPVLLRCDGCDPAGHGPAALEAAQAAFAELLHALDAPVQVVSAARWLQPSDRPAGWDPEVAPAELREAAEHFATHWAALVAQRRTTVRVCLTVIGGPLGGASTGGAGGRATADAEAAFRGFAARIGLTAEAVRAEEWAAVVAAALGAGPPPEPATAAVWGVARRGGTRDGAPR